MFMGSLGRKFFTLYLQLFREAALRLIYLPKATLSYLYLTKMEARIYLISYPSKANLSSHSSVTLLFQS